MSEIKNPKGLKRVVIMGASSGIGLGLAEELARRGVPVGLAARHTDVFADLKEKYPDRIAYRQIDITRPAATGLLQELVDALGGMDIYLHVAGIGSENPTLEPETEVDMIQTNAAGFARMLSAAYRYFRSRGIKGHIAAITSVAGTNGIARLSAYSATKSFGQTYIRALEQLSHNERAGIRFTDIRPGWVKTPLLLPGHEYPLEMSVEHVVPLIIEAIARRRRVAVIDWRWNVVVGLWRLIPNALWTRLDIPVSMPEAQLPPPDQY